MLGAVRAFLVCLLQKREQRMSLVLVNTHFDLPSFLMTVRLDQIDMSNIIDQAQKIIEANGFKDSMHPPSFDHSFHVWLSQSQPLPLSKANSKSQIFLSHPTTSLSPSGWVISSFTNPCSIQSSSLETSILKKEGLYFLIQPLCIWPLSRIKIIKRRRSTVSRVVRVSGDDADGVDSLG